MAEREADLLIQSVKNALSENDGELGYWGDTIALKAPVAAVAPVPLAVPVSTPARKGTKAEQLESLRQDTIGDCQLCPLAATRIKIVFGVGNPETPVMFVGEGPGFDEDRQGEPFVGKAGQLLDKILAAIQLDRTKVYIANIVKCHPMVDASQPDKRGNDRQPAPAEIEKCLPFLKEQISIINPKIIVTLGATATQALLGRSDGITRMRGKVVQANLLPDHEPISVLPTFHPAALLRDESLKKLVWEDMKLLRTLLS